ncbi:hypothetical protein KUTeg_023009 [Tegillarca granosa]|uniref:C1q domain-containing protein n=1 Tax=Tegillarca granosa TaxID=220873 RepID=A0ABQ9E425_TEGGR|nr:hypothetical protein KUTeg_023009 [Tegillarca granosa]
MKNHVYQPRSAYPIAFYARLSNDITTIGDNQAIEYNEVITNLGHGYDSRHGHFIAPIDGIYIFAVTAMGEPNEALHLNIVKNGAIVGYARAALSTEYESGTAVITLSLVAGDMVWVRYGSSIGSASRKVHGGGFNTFSGALLATL